MADPANTPLGQMLLDEITPVVMVLGTPLVEEACLKNGVNFVQMLSPFCSFNSIDVPVRTASDQSYRLQKFKLRLFYASDIGQPNLEAARERLKQVITQAGEKGLSDLISDHPQINNDHPRSESEDLPSWFQFFNKELVRSASFSDHEAFDHPVTCLLVVSSKDEQPINQFVDLFNTNKLPSLFNDGAMDPKILKHYLLVHDNQDGSSEKAARILTEMRSTFGSDCQLLCINSSEGGVVEHDDNPWVPYKSDAPHGQKLGCFLDVDDLNEMKDIMQDLSTKHIIPYMEQKIRLLNQQVSATRKGFKNQIKNLWWRKGKDEVVESSNGSMYTFSSIESQIRVLGDYAFMLRDYELALSNYRLISTDYKIDKAWKRYAGVQEMMGLTYFMLDQSRKEAEYCMENAFNTYLKIGPPGQQNATRCGLWWVEMLKTRDQFKEAAIVYFRVCGEEPLHSAVMLEQASYCYLLSKPPMSHKYGFHLVLSGERYKKSDQIKHAIRTYKNAISVYKETTWSHIKDHVHFNIGQWYAILGNYDLAASHVLEVLACSHQSKATQDIFLKHFLQIVQKTGKTIEVSKLRLPEINLSSLKVVFEDHRTYASPTAASVNESIWRSLEEDLVPSLTTVRTNWLEIHSKILPKKLKDSNVCVAGEAVRVDIEFKNPLQIPISVSSVSLMCELSTSSDETKSDANNSAQEVQNNDESVETTSRETSQKDSFFSLSKADFSLEGGETIMVQLTVTPTVEGILHIVGIRWNLSGVVVGFHNFESNPIKKRSSKGRRRSASRSSGDNLKFVVIKSLPKLEGVIQPLPTSAYAGDVHQLALELRNQSECAVKNLKMKVSHPRFLNVGSQESLNVEFPACLETKTNSGQYNSGNTSQPVFMFPEDTIIKGEKPFLWPLWFRAAVPGNISLYITIYYEIEDTSSTMRYRTLSMHHNLQVLPSLDISFQVSPCPSKLQEFLVRMDIINKTSTESFQVHQLSSVGEKWVISLLQSADTEFPSQCLMAGQSLSCFFMLKDQKKTATPEDKTSSVSNLFGSVVGLGPQGNAGQLFDTSSSPLADFHNCERMHQEISSQSHSTVDFILISRLLKGDPHSGIPDPSHLFSHHSCHCSITSRSPISWHVDGPRTLHHNFSASFCEIKLSMTIYNSSNNSASVHINTHDSSGNSSESTSATTTGNQVGWHDVSLVTDIKVTTDVLATQSAKPPSLDSVSPYIWSAASSTRVCIEPMSTIEIPLQISVFSPGTYDISNYELHWNLLLPNGETNVDSSGTCQGYPYHLTVLQSA